MDKQMIEEMAEIISRDCGACGVCKHNTDHEKGIDCTAFFFATELYNAGYRKIPEGSVVLTKDEYDDMFSFKTTRGGFYNILDTVRKIERKKTAENFAEMAKEKLNEFWEDYEGDDWKVDKGVFILEVIGVEALDGEIISLGLIDEICKEIIGGKDDDTSQAGK